jgi:rare lipoprotein A
MRRVLLLLSFAACGPSEPIYVADETRVSNPRYGGRTAYPRSVPAGYAETEGEEDEEHRGDEAREAAGEQELRALATPRAGDPRGGYRVLATYTGRASYYSDRLAGRPTASGEPYDPTLLTAANRELAFDTLVRVTRLDTGASVIVRINDRGPFGNRRRILDLSRAAAERIDMIRAGVVEVRAEVLGAPE